MPWQMNIALAQLAYWWCSSLKSQCYFWLHFRYKSICSAVQCTSAHCIGITRQSILLTHTVCTSSSLAVSPIARTHARSPARKENEKSARHRPHHIINLYFDVILSVLCEDQPARRGAVQPSHDRCRASWCRCRARPRPYTCVIKECVQ